MSPTDAHADALCRALVAAGDLAAGCGETVVRLAAAARRPMRVSLWPAVACVLMTAGWVAWVILTK